jgi:hypothetical protein
MKPCEASPNLHSTTGSHSVPPPLPSPPSLPLLPPQVLPPWTLQLVASAAGSGRHKCSIMQLHHLHPLTRPLQSSSQRNHPSLPTGAATTLPPPPLLALYVVLQSSKRSSSRCFCPPDDPSCVILTAPVASDSDRVQSLFHRMCAATPPPRSSHPLPLTPPTVSLFHVFHCAKFFL